MFHFLVCLPLLKKALLASAMQDLQNANQDGQEAVAAPTPEEAKVEAAETFDTPHDSSSTNGQ